MPSKGVYFIYETRSQIDAYVAQFKGEALDRLNRLRALTKNVVPEAVESYSYGLIGFKYKGKPLVYYGAFAHHIGFYATPNGHEAFADEFAKYKQGKGSVQLPLDQALPFDLVEKVVKYRVENIEESR